MTNKEYKNIQNSLKRMIKENKITKEDKNNFEKVMKLLYGKCLTCYNNDGYPHSECYDC